MLLCSNHCQHGISLASHVLTPFSPVESAICTAPLSVCVQAQSTALVLKNFFSVSHSKYKRNARLYRGADWKVPPSASLAPRCHRKQTLPETPEWIDPLSILHCQVKPDASVLELRARAVFLYVCRLQYVTRRRAAGQSQNAHHAAPSLAATTGSAGWDRGVSGLSAATCPAERAQHAGAQTLVPPMPLHRARPPVLPTCLRCCDRVREVVPGEVHHGEGASYAWAPADNGMQFRAIPSMRHEWSITLLGTGLGRDPHASGY